MADSKITALTALTAADPINDMLPIVDVSDTTMAASGTTKKISVNNILSSSPTASGALTVTGLVTAGSATITGDLTVQTNALFVNSANNNVGLGTLTPTGASGRALEIYGGAGQSRFVLKNNATGSASSDGSQIALAGTQLIIQNRENDSIAFETNSNEIYRLANDGVVTWSNVGGVAGTAMTLNSTGLGIGVAPTAGRLHVKGGASQSPLALDTLGYNQIVLQVNGANRGQIYADATNCFAVVDAANANTRFVVTDTGNVGIGVTPSAWRNTQRALQVGAVGTLFSNVASNGSTCVGRNIYESTAGDFTYIVNDEATFYEQSATGTHAWYTAVAGTGTIAFGAAKMTIDASGNLILLSSATPATLATNGQLTVNATSNTNLRFSYRGSDGVTRVANITLA